MIFKHLNGHSGPHVRNHNPNGLLMFCLGENMPACHHDDDDGNDDDDDGNDDDDDGNDDDDDDDDDEVAV